MSSRTKHKLPPRRLPEDEIAYRSLALRADGAADGDRSIPALLATEDPVPMFDRRSGKVVNEVLVMSGGSWPAQIPLVDTHDHDTVRAMLGSIRNLSREDTELVGRTYFSTKPDAQDAFLLAKEGHLTDVSVGYERQKVRYLEAGERANYGGREYVGPVKLVTKWRALEGSLTSIGKDQRTKLRPGLRAYLTPYECEKEYEMDTAIRDALVARGMPEDASGEVAVRWMNENLGARSATAEDEGEKPADDKGERSTEKKPPKREDFDPLDPDAHMGERAAKSGAIDAAAAKAAEKAVEDYWDRQATRAAFIRKLVNKSAIPRDKQDEACEKLIAGRSNGAELAAELFDLQKGYRSAIGSTVDIEFTGSGDDGFRSAVLEGFTERVTGIRPEKPISGARQFAGRTLLELSSLCLERAGVSTHGMSKEGIAKRAFRMDEDAGYRSSDGPAFMNTGTMPSLLMDVSNKKLAQGYEAAEVETTYQRWARQAEDAPDFKDINVVNLSELGYQPQVPEGDDYKDLKFSDKREKYRVYKHGSMLSLTLEMIINDDLRAFNRFQTAQAASMRRTINKKIYDELFVNPTLLTDGLAVFHATHSNLVAADLTVANLNSAYQSMMLQTGLNTNVTLNLMPSILLVGPALSATASLILGSDADPTVSQDVLVNTEAPKYNSATVNLYGPKGNRKLNLIVESLIHGNDPNSWYLISASAVVDHMEYAFLRGERTPVMEQETGFVNDTVKFKIRQTWGQKILDFRALYKSTGPS